MSNIYRIQDADRPLYVLAGSWVEALEWWRKLIREENPGDYDDEEPQPDGIELVAESRDVIEAR